MGRTVEKERTTRETAVNVRLDIDGTGAAQINTGSGFFDHMLNSFFIHGGFDGSVCVKGDTFVDFHHSVEDAGIVIGSAFDCALGDRKGIARFGSEFVPMDETLAFASVDISGRPYLVFDCSFPTEKIGQMDTELFQEFFRAFAMNSKITLHMKLLYGSNSHHMAEALFKAAARALKQACKIGDSPDSILSAKGIL